MNTPDRDETELTRTVPTMVSSNSLAESLVADPYPEGSEPRRILDTIVSLLERNPFSTLEEVVTELNENGRFSHILSKVYVSNLFLQAKEVLAGKEDVFNFLADCRDIDAVPSSLLHPRDILGGVDRRCFESSISLLETGNKRKECDISTESKTASSGSSFKKARRGSHEEGFTEEHQSIIEKFVLVDDDIGLAAHEAYCFVTARFKEENLAEMPYPLFNSIFTDIILRNF